MLAYIIMRYDVKFAEEGVRPPNHDVFLNTFPSPGVEVLFRDRRDIWGLMIESIFIFEVSGSPEFGGSTITLIGYSLVFRL